MRIRIDAADRAPYWLVGDPALNDRTEQSASLSDQIQLTRNQQVVAGADWESVLALDRGNQNIQITATTRREFVSEIERMDFIAALAATDPGQQIHPWSGDVTVRVDSATGSTYKDYSLPAATVALTALNLDGAVGLRLTYRVTSGGFGSRSSSGVSGDVYSLTASVPDSTYAYVRADEAETAISDALELGDGVCSLCIVTVNLNSGVVQRRTSDVLFFRNLAAAIYWTNSTAQVDAQGRVTVQGVSVGIRVLVGFVLPFSNAYVQLTTVSIGGAFFASVIGADILFHDPSISASTSYRLHVAKMVRNVYGAIVYDLGSPLAIFTKQTAGEVNLIGTTSIGTSYNLTGFASDE